MYKPILATLALCCAAAPTNAAVQYSDNSTPVTITPVGFAQGYPANSFIIEHSSSASFGSATIWCTNNESLGRIICNNDAVGQLLLIQIGQGDNAPGSWPNNVQSIEIEDGTFPGFRPVIISNMNTNGDVGGISVHRMLNTTIRGDVTGNMIFPLPFFGFDPNANSPAIEDCTIEGDCLASIESETQNIVDLTVKGTFGTAANPQHIFLSSARWIESSKFSEFHGNICNPKGGPISSTADVSFTKAFGGPGSFDGEINIYRTDAWPIQPGELDFQGPMSGTVRLSLGLYAGFGSMKLPGAAQFSGQIILNDSNTEPWWNGPLTLGGVPLTDGYAETPDLLGGGSIGVVPFKLHEEACTPLPNQTFTASNPPASFNLRHYGPVEFTGSSPLIVERKPIGCGTYSPVPAPISASPHPSDNNCIVLAVGTWFEDGYDYRISPNQTGLGMLRSVTHAATTQPTVRDYAYEFSVECPGDADKSGAVNVNDISYVLFRLGQTGCDAEGDIDHSQAVNVNDISYVLFRLGDACE